MCVLVHSCFGKNPLIRSWLTTRLSGWGRYTSRLRDPLGPAHDWQRLEGGGCHLGAPTGALCLRPRPLGLGVTHLSSSPPSFDLHKYLFLFYFLM
jgi:hypothetical protein